MATRQLFTAR